MGSGSWSYDTFKSYTKTTKKVSVKSDGTYDSSHQEIFKARIMNKDLDPCNVIRECRDSEEHPNTIPVILALDVTGSMGNAAVETATKLNKIMTDLYDTVSDVEFMIMGIGDFYCDNYPLQVSQFESDIRIAEQLDKLFFEFGGGANSFESYSSAWYFAANHTKLDCWKRGKRGILITMGDEEYNPYIPMNGNKVNIKSYLGDNWQEDMLSNDIYKATIDKYDIYHINVMHDGHWHTYQEKIEKSWESILDKQHFKSCTIDEISDAIVNIVTSSAANNSAISFVNSDVAKEASSGEETVAIGNGMQEISW